MPLFRRRRETQVPEWAAFMPPEEDGEFTATVAAEVAALGVDWMFGDGAIVLHLGEQPVIAGLGKVAELAHTADAQDRPEVIRAYFKDLVEQQAK